MLMLTGNKVRSRLKNKYNLAIGEATLEKVSRRVAKVAGTKIKISGRSYKTGRRKTIAVSVKTLL